MDIMIAKTHNVTVDEAKLSDDVKAFIWAYGLRQVLNDAGSAGKGAEEKLAMAMKKLDALYAGEVRTRAAGDPIAKAVEALAKADVNAKIKASGKKLKEFDEAKLAAAYRAYAEAHADALRDRAMAGQAAPVADLSDLGL